MGNYSLNKLKRKTLEFEKLYLQEKEKNKNLEEKVIKTQMSNMYITNVKNYDEILNTVNAANEDLNRKIKLIEQVTITSKNFLLSWRKG